jgi:hypothetical protein
MSEAADKPKRELEADRAAEAAEEQPTAKRAKTEADAAAADAEAAGAAEGDADMAEDAEAAAADDENAADGEEAAEEDGDAAEEQVAAEPVKLGYRTFRSAAEASDYIANILKRAKPGENLNEVRSLLLRLAVVLPVLVTAGTRQRSAESAPPQALSLVFLLRVVFVAHISGGSCHHTLWQLPSELSDQGTQGLSMP